MTPEAITAFVSAQAEMGPARKEANNPHFKTKYADLGNVQEACFPALNKHGFAVLQPCGADATGEYVETIFAHSSGGMFSARVYLHVSKNDMQGVGSAITYARRYGLMGLAGIAPEDDDGAAASRNPPARSEPKRQDPKPEKTPKQSAMEWLGSSRSEDETKARMDRLVKDQPMTATDPDVEAAYEKRLAELRANPFPVAAE